VFDAELLEDVDVLELDVELGAELLELSVELVLDVVEGERVVDIVGDELELGVVEAIDDVGVVMVGVQLVDDSVEVIEVVVKDVVVAEWLAGAVYMQEQAL
jgi:hypothetical protein